MQLRDDRTEEQRRTHHVVWMATDRFLSGWGGAKDGPSYAGWACRPEDTYECERWVRNRGDMQRVREVCSDYRPPRGPGDCHIYVWRGRGE